MNQTFCSECGMANDGAAKFCRQCGAAMTTVASGSQGTHAVPAGVHAAASPAVPGTPKSGNTGLLIAGVAAAVVGACFIVNGWTSRSGGMDQLFVGALLLALGVFLFRRGRINSLGALSATPFASSGAGAGAGAAKFHHAYRGSSISLDPETRRISLKEGQAAKTYSYGDVRAWETNIQTGGAVYGTGLAVVAGNFSASASNRANSGLFLKIKDVDFPEWRIELCAPGDKKARKLHARWMEILQQEINQA